MIGRRDRTASLIAASVLITAALALPWTRNALEGQLATHVLVQMPLLAFAGWLVGYALRQALERPLQQWNEGGVPGLLFVGLSAAFWMFPRSVDGAVQQAGHELAKFVSLPIAGLALALSFPRAPVLLRGAIKGHVVSMCLVMAWLYSAAPTRLCTSYLASDQRWLGIGFALYGIALSIVWVAPLLSSPTHQSMDRPVPRPLE